VIGVDQMVEWLFEIVSPISKDIVQELDLDFAYVGARPVSRQLLYRTTGPGAVFRFIPSAVPTRAAGVRRQSARSERRSGLRSYRSHRSGKSTTLAAMIHHINSESFLPHPDDRGSGRIVHESIRAQVTIVRWARTRPIATAPQRGAQDLGDSRRRATQ
jgi:hypothetical protein